MLVSQGLIMLAIVLMAGVDPATGRHSLTLMALAAVMLGFSSATQDIVIDAYRIESAEARLQAMMSSAYIAGYRIGMIVAGPGHCIWRPAWVRQETYVYGNAWRWTYYAMAATMLIGVVTTLVITEPEQNRKERHHYATPDYLRLLLVFALAVAAFVASFL
ncbi:MAG: MFS transporter [Thiolinea sp.]